VFQAERWRSTNIRAADGFFEWEMVQKAALIARKKKK
jgi:hypothetical protein